MLFAIVGFGNCGCGCFNSVVACVSLCLLCGNLFLCLGFGLLFTALLGWCLLLFIMVLGFSCWFSCGCLRWRLCVGYCLFVSVMFVVGLMCWYYVTAVVLVVFDGWYGC